MWKIEKKRGKDEEINSSWSMETSMLVLNEISYSYDPFEYSWKLRTETEN